MRLFILATVLIGFVLGHPQQWRENRDLAILQRYLERAVHEIDTRFKPHQKTERTVDDIIAFIQTLDPAAISELIKPIVDMDIATARVQAADVVEIYFDAIPHECIEALTTVGTLEFTLVTNMDPVRIHVAATLTRLVVLSADIDDETKFVPKLIKETLGQVLKKVTDAGKDIASPLGGGIDSGLQLMDTGFVEVLKTSDETTLGTTYVAELIQVIETFVTAVGPETFQSINCDAANVQSKLNQLNTDVQAVIASTVTAANVEELLNVDSATAQTVATTMTSILNDPTNYIALTKVIQATPTGGDTLGHGMLIAAMGGLLDLAKTHAASTQLVDELIAAVPELPALDTPIADVTIVDLIRTSIAVSNHVATVYQYDCGAAKLAAVIAGFVERKKLDFTIRNPVTHLATDMLTQLAEAVDPDTSSEGIEKELRKNLAEFFSEIFTEAILPLATKIDNDFNNGVAFKTRYHAFILRTIFVIKTPETLYDILRLSIPIIATGLMEDVACQSEPTIPDLSTALEEMLANTEAVAASKIETTVTALNTEANLGLTDDEIATTMELLGALIKVIMPMLNSDLLELQASLEVNPTLESARAAMAAETGAHIYRSVWEMKLMRTLIKARKERE